MTEELKFFRDDIPFKKYLTDGNSKILKNQNLQPNHSLNFSSYLGMFLYSCILERQFSVIRTHQL